MAVYDIAGYLRHQPRWAGILDAWLTDQNLVVGIPNPKAGNRDLIWEVKEFTSPCPPGVALLGCSGRLFDGTTRWIGWDLDVGHGSDHYETFEEALFVARKIRDALKGFAEIRTSKSGNGLHIRHQFPAGADIPVERGPNIAKTMVKRLNIRADRSPLGRQVFFLWARNAPPSAFRLIEPHAGLVYSDQ